MEGLKIFDIHLDINDREYLYDYGHEERIQRPNEGWSSIDLRTRSLEKHLESSDESFQTRVKMMDIAHNPVGFFEKKGHAEPIPEEFFRGFSTLQEEQSLPQRVLPVYRPGDAIKGTLVVQVTSPIKAERLKLTFYGRSFVKIRVYHGRGYYDDKGSDVYVKGKKILWKKEDKSSSSAADEMQLLSLYPDIIQSKLLDTGKHSFPFEFHIPQDAPGSVVPLIQSYCDQAFLSYTIKATLNLGKTFGRGDAVATKGLLVSRPYDIAAGDPKELEEVTVEEEQETGVLVKSGLIRVKATLPRKAYVRKEVIPLTLLIENGNSNDITSVSARVVLTGKVRTGEGVLRPCKSTHVKSIKAAGEAVHGNGVSQQKLNLPLDFSQSYIDTNLIPVGTLADCRLLDVRYEIIIKIKRPGLHRNLEVKVPVTIGNLNSSPQEPQ